MDNIKNMRKLEQATSFNRADFIKLGLAICLYCLQLLLRSIQLLHLVLKIQESLGCPS